MKLENFEGYTYVDGGVCAARGFVANGLNAGINPDKKKNDMCLVYSQEPCSAAGVYTQNKVKGAPVIVTRENLKRATASHMRYWLIPRMPILVTLMVSRLQKRLAGWHQISWESSRKKSSSGLPVSLDRDFPFSHLRTI